MTRNVCANTELTVLGFLCIILYIINFWDPFNFLVFNESLVNGVANVIEKLTPVLKGMKFSH